MPAVRAAASSQRGGMFHERDATSLDGVRHEDLGDVFRRCVHRCKRSCERRVIVTVAHLDVPAECAQLSLQVAERQDLLGRPIGLELVPVDDRPEIADALVRRGGERLPVLSLLKLAVAGHHDDATSAPEEALSPGHPPALRKAHAERARVRLDARNAEIGMAVEAAQPAQAEETLGRDDAECMQGCVETWHVVALGREEHVAVRMVPAELGDVQFAPEEVDDDVERAEARAEMTRPGTFDGDERVRPAHVGDESEILVLAGALELGARNERQLCHGCSRRTSSFTSAPHPGPAGILSLPSAICGTAVVSSSRHGTSSTSTSRMRTFGIAAHHCAEMNVARWL